MNMSTELRRYFSLARTVLAIARPVSAIAVLCGFAVLVGGEIPCATKVLGEAYRTRDGIVLILWSVFVVAMIRKMADEGDEKLRNSFELYNLPIVEIASQKLTFSLGMFSIILIGALGSLLLGIAIALSPLWAISTGCFLGG